MTYSSRELLAQRRPEESVQWRQRRRRWGLKLCEAAAAIGCSADYLHRIETGKYRPRKSRVIEALHAFYGVAQ